MLERHSKVCREDMKSEREKTSKAKVNWSERIRTAATTGKIESLVRSQIRQDEVSPTKLLFHLSAGS